MPLTQRGREMLEQFTPGPWTAKCAKSPVDGEFDWGISADFNGRPYVISEAFGRVSETITPAAQANANLIAAAPDLYAALDRAWDLLCDIAGSGHLELKEQCSAALAKARGEK